MSGGGKPLAGSDTALEFMSKDDLIDIIRSMVDGGVSINFHGKRFSHEVYKKVRPRQTIIKKDLSFGSADQQVRNLLIEGENLQAMVTLYKERGQVDLIVTDPPYNTGQNFRYNDKWDEDPNDPDLGQVVKIDDGSRHTKWMKAMLPRLHMMHAMLKPSGVLAICIDDNELFHLGMMLDEIFGEENRIGIINWQKTTPKPQSKNISITTEYVLIYAKDLPLAKTSDVERSALSNSRFANVDNDLLGDWKQDNLTGKGRSKGSDYAIQSPFTGEFHDPGTRHWANKRTQMKAWAEEWDVRYEDCDIGDKRGLALALAGWSRAKTKTEQQAILNKSKKAAVSRLEKGNWPLLYWGLDGLQKPVKKSHKALIKQGAVPQSFWLDDDEAPLEIGAVSWLRNMSGRTRDGAEELSNIVGPNHGFDTVKPLRLIRKIIQIWCPPNGLVLDPYAGSGTTGHAVLELNSETEAQRRFILIEQGAPDRGDKYARSLTQLRLRHVLTGERPTADGTIRKTAEALPGGFQFRQLTQKIDSRAVLTMKKDELIDLVITSHWDNSRRNSVGLIRFESADFKYLVGRNEQNEGYFLIWNGGDKVGQLDESSYATVIAEGKKAGLKQPYHVYARYEIYQSRSVLFYKIPDRILAHLGLNESSDSFNEEE